MKKFNLFIAFAFWTIVAAGLCVGCGHLLAGTAEEPNEMTADCDKDCESKSSSSSSEPSGLSSVVEDPSPRFNDFSLDYYLALFGVDSLQFDGGVLAAKGEHGPKPPPSSVEPGQSASPGANTEFDGPCPNRFNAGNIEKLETYFPDEALEYAGLADSIRKGIASGGCGLYMMTVEGSSKYAGFVLAGVAKDTVSVIDIAVPSCKVTTESMVFRFLFRYCGEIGSCPVAVHEAVNVDMPADKCKDLQPNAEWVLDK